MFQEYLCSDLAVYPFSRQPCIHTGERCTTLPLYAITMTDSNTAKVGKLVVASQDPVFVFHGLIVSQS